MPGNKNSGRKKKQPSTTTNSSEQHENQPKRPSESDQHVLPAKRSCRRSIISNVDEQNEIPSRRYTMMIHLQLDY